MVGGSGFDFTEYITEINLAKAQGLICVIVKNSNGWGLQNHTIFIGQVHMKFTLAGM